MIAAYSVACFRLSEHVYDALNALFKLIRHIECRKLINTEAALCLAEEGLIVELALQYLLTLIYFEPFNALAIFPKATLILLVWHFVRAQSVLLASAPVAPVRASI